MCVTFLRGREPWSLWTQASLCLQELGITGHVFLHGMHILSIIYKKKYFPWNLGRAGCPQGFTPKMPGLSYFGHRWQVCSWWWCVYTWNFKERRQKEHLHLLGLSLEEYLHGWRIIYRVCVFTVLQGQHLIRNWGLIANKCKLVQKIDKKIQDWVYSDIKGRKGKIKTNIKNDSQWNKDVSTDINAMSFYFELLSHFSLVSCFFYLHVNARNTVIA